MGGEIVVAQIAADAAEIGVHRPRELALVERVAAALRERLIALREIGILEDLALHAAVRR